MKASRPGFYRSEGKVLQRNVTFEWSGGFAISQKKKNVASMHQALGKPALEVSTKSDEELGKKLSAFSLKLDGYTLENIFQSSKVFEKGGPYLDLLDLTPKEAKTDERLRSSGKLKMFFYENTQWMLEPKTAFYDYIYCKAVKECISNSELENILKYEYFTDIEFNPKRSINTQARSIVIVKLFLEKHGKIPELNKEDFLKFHKMALS